MLVALLVVAGSMPLRSEVFWEFQLGGMYMPRTTSYMCEGDKVVKNPNDSKQGTWNALGGFGLFIPLSSRVPLLIETGLRYRNAPIINYGKRDNTWVWVDPKVGRGNFVELPLKLNYELRLNELNSFRFGLGAYGAYMIDGSEGNQTGLSVGIEPSVVFCHRGISFGLSYTNPLIYSAYKNKLGSNIALTFGIKFKSGAWKYIGAGLGAVATLGATAAVAYQSSQDSSGYSSDSSSSYSSGSSSSGGSNYETMYRKWEKRAKEAFDSLDGHSGSAGTYQRNKKLLRDAQKEMRSWRQKAYKAGVIIPQSEWEDKTVKAY